MYPGGDAFRRVPPCLRTLWITCQLTNDHAMTMRSPATHNPPRVLIQAGRVLDGRQVDASPGAILLEWSEGDGGDHGADAGYRVRAAGTPESIGASGRDETRVLTFPTQAIVPAFVNPHSHLDLSHLGPLTPGVAPGSVRVGDTEVDPTDFVAWIKAIRPARHESDDAIARAVDTGIALSLRGGVSAVGDIAGAGSFVPARQLAASPLNATSYIEFFGTGPRQTHAIDAIDEVLALPAPDASLRLGLQPHAPYSCGHRVYEHAAAHHATHGLPLQTHLAETRAEHEFIADGAGPFRSFLESVGLFGPEVCVPSPGALVLSDQSPVSALASVLKDAPWTLAHCNYIDDDDLARLAAAHATVIYCPRAHASFGHSSHRWRDMRTAGVRVVLGTDGWLCTDSPQRLTTFDEWRWLVARENASAESTLAMVTSDAAASIGHDPARWSLAATTARSGGLVALGDDLEDPLGHALTTWESDPEWVLNPSGRLAHAPE